MKARHITPEEFDRLLAGNKPVLVDFWAPWCPYCVKITEAYDMIAEEFADSVEVVKVNIDDYEALCDAQGVEVIPTLILYQGGKALDQIVAPESKAVIERFIGKTLEKKKQRVVHPVEDMLIIGGGPGGYTAALYAARAGLSVTVLEKLAAGGQMALTEQVDNYPGFIDGINGPSLSRNMILLSQRFGANTVTAEVMRVDLTQNPKVVETSEGVFLGKTVVIATGAGPRKLGLPEEDALVNRGVAYCAACDGMFFKDKVVAVIGGGNSAAADAILLSRIAKEVHIIHRRDTLRATKIYHAPLENAQNVIFHWNSVTEEILHDERVTGLKLKNVQTGEASVLPVDGVFISVGRVPASQLVKDQIDLDESGYILADESTRTNIPGVFAVGDVRVKALRQVVTAVSDGAVAAHMAEEFLAAQ